MKIVFAHGLASSGKYKMADSLRILLRPATVISPDLPLEPGAAVSLLREICDKERPDLVVGLSLGGFMAQKLHGERRLLVNPDFHPSRLLRTMIGENKYLSLRADGALTFTVTEEVCRSYELMEQTQFEGIDSSEAESVTGMFADADEMATEFVIMTTKAGTTNVSIDLPVNSNKGKTQHIDIPLSGSKQIYIVRSKAPNPEDPDDVIDLSGSTICADQPIAVWSGNQLASVPNQDAMSKDHAYDQLLPVTKWGKKFLIPPTGNHTQYNEIHVSGLLDNTSVVVRNIDGTKNWTMSSRDDSIVVLQGPLGGNLEGMETYIEADKPIQVYLYSSAGAANPYDAIEGGVRKRHLQGDPAMTIIPPLEYLTDTTVFQTYNGGDGGLVHEMRLWARTSDVSGIRLNGNDISSQFSTTPYVSGYSIATIPLTHRIYTITAPKKCFSGYVYGMNDGQTYMYPVGYDFTPQKDTLFLLDNSRQYDVHHDGAPSEEWKANYVSNTEGGWFLDKVLQNDDTYLLDSTFVCDSTILDFPIKTYNAWYKTVWEIEGSIQGRGYFTPIEQLAEDVVRPQLEHQFHLLPIAQNQEPFEDFEVRGIVIRKPIFCDIPEDKWERDTFNTVVRVMRQYDDTTWHVMCIGDTIKFFYDSLYDQGNLSRYDGVVYWDSFGSGQSQQMAV